jgi:hypothetical protein
MACKPAGQPACLSISLLVFQPDVLLACWSSILLVFQLLACQTAVLLLT